MKAILTEAIKESIKEAVIDAVVSNDGVWKEIDKVLQDDLDSNKNCWLSFNEGVASCLIGLGTGEAGARFAPEISIDDYEGLDLSEPKRHQQLDDVKEQIAGIEQFIKKLEAAKAELEAVLP